MKHLKSIIGTAVLGGLLTLSGSAVAADQGSADQAKKSKPYTLKTCIVTDEKLGGDMGKPYVFVHEGQEMKLCCKGCLRDFNKEPAKYLKKLAVAQKGAKDKAVAPAQEHGGHSGLKH